MKKCSKFKGLNIKYKNETYYNNWNVCQYAVLVHMFAQVCGYEVGELVHVIADAHIYDRHIPIIQELIQRPTYEAPTFWMNPDIKDFYEFTVEDFELRNYKFGPKVENIPVAV